MARKSDSKGGAVARKGGPGGPSGAGSKGKDALKGKAQQQGRHDGGTDAGGKSSAKISCADIQYVQNLIERCLQQYMAKKDVVYALQNQARIEPGFTSLVWQKLEEQNPEFFAAYYVRLKLKDQVVLFNHLLEQQVQMNQKLHSNQMDGWGHQQGKPMGGGMLGRMGSGYAVHVMGTPLSTMDHQGVMPSSGAPIFPGNAHAVGGDLASPQGHMDGGGMYQYMSQPQAVVGQSGMPTSDGPLQNHFSSALESVSQAEGHSHVMPKVFSLTDLTMELGQQIATEGDASLSLLAGYESSGLGVSGLGTSMGGMFPRNFSLGEIAKLEVPLDMVNE